MYIFVLSEMVGTNIEFGQVLQTSFNLASITDEYRNVSSNHIVSIRSNLNNPSRNTSVHQHDLGAIYVEVGGGLEMQRRLSILKIGK